MQTTTKKRTPDRDQVRAERFIAEARRILKPSPVRIHHVPNWFRLAVINAFRGRFVTQQHGPMSGHDAVSEIIRRFPDLGLDHWGSAKWGDVTAFVSEPYLDSGDVAAGQKLADAIGCRFIIDPNSWWYPGHTTRLVWVRPAPPLGD